MMNLKCLGFNFDQCLPVILIVSFLSDLGGGVEWIHTQIWIQHKNILY